MKYFNIAGIQILGQAGVTIGSLRFFIEIFLSQTFVHLFISIAAASLLIRQILISLVHKR